MPRRFKLANALMWILSLAVAFTAARYFLDPVPGLYRAQALALARHSIWLLSHIVAGILAITLGLFQFVRSLRVSRPSVHRAIGLIYVVAVVGGGFAGLVLSPDTPAFAADILNDSKIFDMSVIGLSPSFLGYGPSSTFIPSQFLLVRAGFTALSILWPLTSMIAFVRARQRRFSEHQAWMIRSYSLTFAAVSVRLAGFPFLVLTRNPVVAITCTFWSWILNLMVAEWLVRRRESKPLRQPMMPLEEKWSRNV